MDKKSRNYMMSSFDIRFYGDDSYTTLKRDFEASGNSREYLRSNAHHIKNTVMP